MSAFLFFSPSNRQNALGRTSKRPHLIWTISENDANFKSLDHSQLVNHFEGISTLTTKMGLVTILRDMPWISSNSLEVAPRLDFLMIYAIIIDLDATTSAMQRSEKNLLKIFALQLRLRSCW